MFGNQVTLNETVQIWGTIISAVIMIATIAQVVVAYLISQSIRNATERSELIRSSMEVNRQWQHLNTLVITNSEFRETLKYLEGRSQSDKEIKLEYIIYLQLNTLHDAFHAGKISKRPVDYLYANIRDILPTLSGEKELVVKILDGSRGYDEEFITLCKKILEESKKLSQET